VVTFDIIVCLRLQVEGGNVGRDAGSAATPPSRWLYSLTYHLSTRGIPRISLVINPFGVEHHVQQAVYVISRTYRSPLRMRARRYSLYEHVEL